MKKVDMVLGMLAFAVYGFVVWCPVWWGRLITLFAYVGLLSFFGGLENDKQTDQRQ